MKTPRKKQSASSAAQAAPAPPALPAADPASPPAPPRPCLAIDCGSVATRWALYSPQAAEPLRVGCFPSAVAALLPDRQANTGLDADAAAAEDAVSASMPPNWAPDWRLGEAAVAGSLRRAEQTFVGPARLLGAPYASAQAQALGLCLGEHRVADLSGNAAFALAHGAVHAEELTAYLLAHAQQLAAPQPADADAPLQVCLLLASGADFATRRAWCQAAALAGLTNPTLVHVTTAAAYAAAELLVARDREGPLCVVELSESGMAVTLAQVRRLPPAAAAEQQKSTAVAKAAAAAAENDAVARTQDAGAGPARAGQADAAAAQTEDAEDVDGLATSTDDVATAATSMQDAEHAEAAPADSDAAPGPAAAASAASALALAPGGVGSPPAAARAAVQMLCHRAASGCGLESSKAALVAWLRQQYAAEQGHPLPAAAEDPLLHGRLWSAAERARQMLAEGGAAEVHLPYVTTTAEGPQHLTASLRQDEWAAFTEEGSNKVLSLCRAACRAAQVEPRDVRGWVLVGGGSQDVALVGKLRRLFGNRNPLLGGTAEVDALAVRGAALLHGAQPEQAAGAAAQECCVAALAYVAPGQAGDAAATELFARGTPLPATQILRVQTQVAEQDLVRVPLLLGEPDDVHAWREVGFLQLDDLVAAPAGLVCEVEVTLDVGHRLHCTGRALTKSGPRPLSVKQVHPSGLDAQAMARLARTFAAAAEARLVRQRYASLKADAEALLEAAPLAAPGPPATEEAPAGADAPDSGLAPEAPAHETEAQAQFAELAQRHERLRAALRDALQEATAGDAAADGAAGPRRLADLGPLEGHINALRALRPMAAARPLGGAALGG